MHAADILILLAVGALVVLALRSLRRHGSGCGGCSGCAGGSCPGCGRTAAPKSVGGHKSRHCGCKGGRDGGAGPQKP